MYDVTGETDGALALVDDAELQATGPLPGELTEVGYLLPPDLSFDAWEHAGAVLKRMERAIRFWLGDWLNYGERQYGETYSQAIEVTGATYQALANCAYVARSVEFSRRRENLSFGHHAEVAALPAPEQDLVLERADSEGWSTRRLREFVRSGNWQADQPAEPPLPKCRRCGHACDWCAMEATR